MKIPLQIVFRHMESSEALESKIKLRTEKLEKFSDDIIGCRVVLEEPHHHHQQGGEFHVCIYITVPGNELVACRDPGKNSNHQDPYVAVRDAFNAMEKQLREYTDKRKGHVKLHEVSESANLAV